MSRNGSRRFENGTKQISAHKDLKGQCPESVIGRGVNIRGTLSFEKLLRIDGQFEGQLISKGSLIIGSEGVLIGNIQNMSALVLDGGKLYGNVVVDKLFLRGASYLKGDVCCKYLTVDKHATLMGNCNIHPLAPEIIDENGDIIIPNEEAPVRRQTADSRKQRNGNKGPLAPVANVEVNGQDSKEVGPKLLRSNSADAAQHDRARQGPQVQAPQLGPEKNELSPSTNVVVGVLDSKGSTPPVVAPSSLSSSPVLVPHSDGAPAVHTSKLSPMSPFKGDNKDTHVLSPVTPPGGVATSIESTLNSNPDPHDGQTMEASIPKSSSSSSTPASQPLSASASPRAPLSARSDQGVPSGLSGSKGLDVEAEDKATTHVVTEAAKAVVAGVFTSATKSPRDN